MLAPTPCQLIVAALTELVSWQVTQVTLDTAAWPATDSTGELVILKFVAKTWQEAQSAVPVGMWLAANVMAVTPYHMVFVLAWQLAQLRAETAAWPAAANAGVEVILNAPTENVDPWQVLQSPVPIAIWFAAPVVPTAPGGPLA